MYACSIGLESVVQVPEQLIRLGPVTWRTINAPHPLEDPLRSSVEICVANTHVKAYLFSCEYPPHGSVPLYILQ